MGIGERMKANYTDIWMIHQSTLDIPASAEWRVKADVSYTSHCHN
jgi:hypothetical protein